METTGPPGERGARRSLLCAALLMVFDLANFSAHQALPTWSCRGAFFLQAVATGGLLATALFWFYRWSARLVAILSRFEVARRRWLGPALQGAVLIGVAFVFLYREGPGGERVVVPPWQEVLVPVTAAAYVAGARFALRKSDRPAHDNWVAILAVFVEIWFVRRILAPDPFVVGAADFARTLAARVTLSSCLVIDVGATLFSLRRAALRSTRGRVASLVPGLPILGFLCRANARYYVDLYFEFHTLLLLFSVACAWHLADALVPSVNRRLPLLSARARMAWGALGLGSLAIMGAPPNAAAHYAGALHTVDQRFVFDTLHTWRDELEELAGPRAPEDRGVGGPARLASTFQQPTREPTSRPAIKNLVLLLLDKKRPKDLALGPDLPKTTACFAGSYVFTRAYAAANSTLTSYPGIYSSEYLSTRVPGLDTTRVIRWQPEGNLVNAFLGAGFRTILLTNRWYQLRLFNPRSPAIFSVPAFFQEVIGENAGGCWNASGESSTNICLTEALQRAYIEASPIAAAPEPFILVVHVYDHSASPHLKNVDDLIGDICNDLEAAGRMGETALLLTADHGFQEGEHGRADSYGTTLFDEEVRVPLLVRIPGMQGRRVDSLVTALDHLPTLFDLFGLPMTTPVEGRSYWPVLSGSKPPEDRAIFLETAGPSRAAAVVRGHFKLIRWFNPGVTALFDLEADPGENRSLVDLPRFEGVERSLAGELRRFLQEHGYDEALFANLR